MTTQERDKTQLKTELEGDGKHRAHEGIDKDNDEKPRKEEKGENAKERGQKLRRRRGRGMINRGKGEEEQTHVKDLEPAVSSGSPVGSRTRSGVDKR